MSPLTVRRFGEYMRKHQVQEDGKVRESDNWQKGIPLKSYMDSLVRHLIDVWGIHRGAWSESDDGGDLEDVLCGVKFNVDGLLHELVKKRLAHEARPLPVARGTHLRKLKEEVEAKQADDDTAVVYSGPEKLTADDLSLLLSDLVLSDLGKSYGRDARIHEPRLGDAEAGAVLDMLVDRLKAVPTKLHCSDCIEFDKSQTMLGMASCRRGKILLERNPKAGTCDKFQRKET